VGALIEILQAHSAQNEWRLLLPALAASGAGPLVLVGAPHLPFGPGLSAQGLDPQRLLGVRAGTPAARMWACEQALRCAAVDAVLAWLPQARADQLRRLQMAASEHGKLLFVMRPARAQNESSPAVLRLLASLQPGGDGVLLEILKRKGPPLAQPLLLPARAARLAALLACSHGWGRLLPATGMAEPHVRVGRDALSHRVEPHPQAGRDAPADRHVLLADPPRRIASPAIPPVQAGDVLARVAAAA
jgi:protein ImuA